MSSFLSDEALDEVEVEAVVPDELLLSAEEAVLALLDAGCEPVCCAGVSVEPLATGVAATGEGVLITGWVVRPDNNEATVELTCDAASAAGLALTVSFPVLKSKPTLNSE